MVMHLLCVDNRWLGPQPWPTSRPERYRLATYVLPHVVCEKHLIRLTPAYKTTPLYGTQHSQ